MPAYVQHAASLGLQEICFLDHLTLCDTDGKYTMTADEVPLYVQAVRRLQHRYRDILDIKLGIEVDFTPETVDRAIAILERFAFDAIGASVHFVDGRNIVSRRLAASITDGDIPLLWHHYLEQLMHLLDRPFFDFVCHLDAPKKLGRPLPPELDKFFNEILAKIRYKDLSIEINTSGLDHPAGEIYPGEPWIQKSLSLGIPMVFGSDAHRPEEIGRHIAATAARLQAMGMNQTATFSRRRRRLIPLATLLRTGNNEGEP